MLSYRSAIPINARGDILQANDYYLSILGCTREELLSGQLDWRKVTPPEWLPADERALAQLREQGVCDTYEKEYVRQDGTRVPVLITDAMMPGDSGDILAFVFDITERKRADEALRESEERYRLIFETANEGIWVTDGEGRTILVNQRMADMLGYTADELQGRIPSEFLHADQDSTVLRARQELTAGATTHYEFRFRRKDGADLWVISSAAPVKDGEGRLIRTISMLSDITERKQAETALRASEQRWATTLSSIGDAVIASDIEGRITFMNAVAEELTGWLLGEASMKPVTEVFKMINEHTRQQVQDPVAKVIEYGVIVGLANHTVLVRKDGTEVPIDDSGAPIMDKDGNIVGVVLVFRDITERKQAEDQLRASLAEKEVLLKEIHHRVKNNMQVVSSLVGLQASGLGDHEQGTVRILDDLRGRVKTMALVHEKLYRSGDMSRVEFAEYSRSLLRSIWQANASDAARVELRIDLQPLSLTIETAIPCGLILNELATNTLKHAFRGRDNGAVTVSLYTAYDGQSCLTVSDNGIGLPADLDWQHSQTLGLQLVNMLTSQIDGTLEVETSKGKGTEFRIRFWPNKGKN